MWLETGCEGNLWGKVLKSKLKVDFEAVFS